MRFSFLFLIFFEALIPSAYATDIPYTFPHDQANTKPHFPTTQSIITGARKSREKLAHFKPDNVPVQSFPKIITPSTHVDFNEVINNANSVRHVLTHPQHRPAGLLVFVSFSMPQESLKRLARQAGLAHAAVMLRGLVADAKGKPSFHATAIEVGRLKLQTGQGFSVNPMTFKKYGVTQVPAFVLLTQPDCTTCGEGFIPTHIKLAGDVSLDYALRIMQTRSPSDAERIKPYLARLKTGFFKERRKR